MAENYFGFSRYELGGGFDRMGCGTLIYDSESTGRWIQSITYSKITTKNMYPSETVQNTKHSFNIILFDILPFAANNNVQQSKNMV